MANLEHVALVKKGWGAWKEWRKAHSSIVLDFSGADLSGVNLSGMDLGEANLSGAHLVKAKLNGTRFLLADLSRADLSGADIGRAYLHAANLIGAELGKANLIRANLGGADLSRAQIGEANLDGADLSGAKLSGAKLIEAKLCGANLSEAVLNSADLRGADLSGADLSGADLSGADLSGANLDGANLSGASLNGANLSGAKLIATNLAGVSFGDTILANVDLSRTKGLQECSHWAPSAIDHRTLAKSGPLPLVFLRGCGLPDALITYLPSIFATGIEFDSCFISYSTKDQDFADRLHADLQNRGVRCWFAPHDMKGGKKIHEQIDAAIQLHDRLLLILSKASMSSDWVQTEIAKARKREGREKRRMLFPLRLVEFEVLQEWECFDADTGKDSAREIREYFVPDFSEWKNHDDYQKAFGRLLKDLKAELPGPATS